MRICYLLSPFCNGERPPSEREEIFILAHGAS